MQRILALESLRGLAALIVVFTHIAVAFYPSMIFGFSSVVAHSRFEQLVAQSPLNIFVSGRFAVICFFVLSGFVLAFGYYTKKIDLITAAIKRYFRLAPIVLASIIFSYFIMKLGLYYNHQASIISHSAWWNLFWDENLQRINILDALWQGLIGTFVIQPTTQNSLNQVLWTIYYELIGSYLVFAILSLTNTDRRRWLIYLLLVGVFINTYFIGFIVGLILCDIYVHKPNLLASIGNSRKGYKVILFVAAIVLASYPANLKVATDIGFIHLSFAPFPLTEDFINQNIIYTLAGVIFIILLLTSNTVKRILEKKIFVLLGSMSYSLYATHLLLLGSVGSYLFIKFTSILPYHLAAFATIVCYLITCIGVAYLFRRYIDIPSIALSRKVINIIGFNRKKENTDTIEAIL
jgi:peptidoglycan/LPS O-acetylase OafA/YrhL